MTITIFNNLDELYVTAISLRVYSHANFREFLSTCKGETFGMTKMYFFKTVPQIAFKEVRFYIKSKRVTTSKTKTV